MLGKVHYINLTIKLYKIVLYNLILKVVPLRLLKVFTLGLLEVNTVRPHKVFPGLILLKVFTLGLLKCSL